MLKVIRNREEIEKIKREHQQQAEEEKMEKFKQITQSKAERVELEKKKLLNLKKFNEAAEDRRRIEEQKKIEEARLKEEERLRILAIKRKEEELERQRKLAEEKELQKVKYPLKPILKGSNEQNINKTITLLNQTFDLGKKNSPKPPANRFDSNNYDLNDLHSGDSTDEGDEGGGDEHKQKPKKYIPKWAKNVVFLGNTNLANDKILLQLKLQFWDCRMKTPDLRAMFNSSNPKLIKRTSSAIWNTPPAFKILKKTF